jgi:hypothetical protein
LLFKIVMAALVLGIVMFLTCGWQLLVRVWFLV